MTNCRRFVTIEWKLSATDPVEAVASRVLWDAAGSFRESHSRKQARHSFKRNVVLDFSFGRVAQLGERIHGMDEVAGSTPVTSTKFSDISTALHRSISDMRSDFRTMLNFGCRILALFCKGALLKLFHPLFPSRMFHPTGGVPYV